MVSKGYLDLLGTREIEDAAPPKYTRAQALFASPVRSIIYDHTRTAPCRRAWRAHLRCLRRNRMIVAACHVHRVADRGAVEHDRAIVAGDRGLEFGDRLVGPDQDDLSTRPVIVSPGRTGALKDHSTLRNTVPGPGNSSATTALRIALVTPP
jgi:hypothetical protein